MTSELLYFALNFSEVDLFVGINVSYQFSSESELVDGLNLGPPVFYTLIRIR